MSYNVDDLDKILSYKSWSDRKKVNTLLEIDADIYCNLGAESTKTEILNAKKQSRRIYKAIKSIDKYWGEMMLRETQ
tara:strand:- start:317 stop:547 length:231 start_codon:yes stop_codon:yes gene_type:complete